MGSLTTGSGDGYGYGYGYGSGSGYGYGSGSGDGYGSGEYTLALIEAQVGAHRVAQLKESGATVGFWKSDGAGRPSNGGTGPSRTVGMVEEIEGPLQVCTPRALHATDAPWKWRGSRLWIVALYGEVQWGGDKMGALKREILAEVVPNPFE